MTRHLIPLILLLSTSVTRADINAEPIDYQHGNKPFQGILVYDNQTTTPRPAVLVCPEWYGVNDFARNRAEALAKLGYVAFVLRQGHHGEEPRRSRQDVRRPQGRPRRTEGPRPRSL